jgi:hypothetical protein
MNIFEVIKIAVCRMIEQPHLNRDWWYRRPERLWQESAGSLQNKYGARAGIDGTTAFYSTGSQKKTIIIRSNVVGMVFIRVLKCHDGLVSGIEHRLDPSSSTHRAGWF